MSYEDGSFSHTVLPFFTEPGPAAASGDPAGVMKVILEEDRMELSPARPGGREW